MQFVKVNKPEINSKESSQSLLFQGKDVHAMSDIKIPYT